MLRQCIRCSLIKFWFRFYMDWPVRTNVCKCCANELRFVAVIDYINNHNRTGKNKEVTINYEPL